MFVPKDNFLSQPSLFYNKNKYHLPTQILRMYQARPAFQKAIYKFASNSVFDEGKKWVLHQRICQVKRGRGNCMYLLSKEYLSL